MQPNAKAVAPKWYEKTWLVIIIIILFFPVGLYGLWKSSSISKGWKWGVTVFYGLFISAAIASPPPPETKASVKPSTKPNREEIKEVKTEPKEEFEEAKNEIKDKKAKPLFDTPDDFKDAFNKFASSNSLDLNIDELEIKEGEAANVFNYQFTDHLGVVGSVDKSNGCVNSLILIGSGDGSVKSGGNIILGMCGIIAAVDPSIKPENRLDILKGLGLLGKSKVDYADMPQKELIKNGIKYTITSSASMGLWFSASRNEGS
jgi:hypothetical protein